MKTLAERQGCPPPHVASSLLMGFSTAQGGRRVREDDRPKLNTPGSSTALAAGLSGPIYFVVESIQPPIEYVEEFGSKQDALRKAYAAVMFVLSRLSSRQAQPLVAA